MDSVFKIEQANGWLNVEGESDLTFSVRGVGDVDFDNADKATQPRPKSTTPSSRGTC